MSITGLGSAIEYAEETAAYGTDLAKTKSIPFISESFSYVPGFATGTAIRFNNSLPQSADVIRTNRVIEGDLVVPLYTLGHLEWLKSCYEDYVFATATPNTHTYLIGQTGATHPAISADVFVGGVTAQESKNVTGIIVNGYSVSAAAEDDAPIEVTYSCIAKDLVFTDADTAVGVEIAANEQMNWSNLTISLAASECVSAFSMDVTIPKSRRWCLGNTTTNQPDREGRASVTGTLDMYFDDWNEADDMVAGTERPLVITATGDVTPAHTFVWTNNIHFTGGTAMVDGEDRIVVSMNWEALSSTANDQDASGHTLVVSNTEATL